MNPVEDSILIGNKLEKETARFKLLKESVEKYNALSKNMSSILTTFEQRLGKLEQTILPVYNETEHLQHRQSNLENTLQCLETVLSHYDASQEVCHLIHLGPSEGNIAVFLDGLDKLKRAKDYFLNNNSQSVELENVTSLFNTGCESLNNHFKALLKKHSYPMKPVDLLDLIYIEEDSSNEDCSSIKQLSPNTREELNTIANWLEQNLRREYKEIYSEERSDVVFRSLQHLKDHQKSGSWGNEPLKTRHYGRMEAKKSTSARLQSIFEKKANKMFLRASQTLEQSTGFSLKKNAALTDHLTSDDYLDGDQELDKYLVLLLGLQRLLVWERTLLNDIIPPSQQPDVFLRLAENSIDLVIKDAESITNRILRCISRKEWSSALGIFSALKRVILLQPDIDRTCDMRQKEQLNKVMNKLQQTGAKTLEQFLEAVKADSGTNIVGMTASTLSGTSVPKDATVYELTSNTIWFIEHLFEHFDVIGGILQQDPAYMNTVDSLIMRKNFSAEEKNKALLGVYIRKVLAELNLTIVNKCEQYSDTATKNLFRLNNVHYVLKSLQQSNLLDLVRIVEPECERSYLDIIGEMKLAYQRSWSKLLSYISPLDELPRAINGKVKEKERAIIKERFFVDTEKTNVRQVLIYLFFQNFNKEFEEACKIQRGISVPDVILREGLKRDNAEQIIPKYNRFFETYSDVQFSKNPEKYIKYRPQDVNALLNNLFDDSVV